MSSFLYAQTKLRDYEGKITKNGIKDKKGETPATKEDSSDSESDSDSEDDANNKAPEKEEENATIGDHLLVNNEYFAFTTGSDTSITVKALHDDTFTKEINSPHPFLLAEFYPGSVSPVVNDDNSKKKRRHKKKKKGKETTEETAETKTDEKKKDLPNIFFLSTLKGASAFASKKMHFAVTSIESGKTVKEHTVSQSWYLDQYPLKSAGFCSRPVNHSGSAGEHWQVYWRKNQINFWDMENEKEYMAMDTV